MCDSSKIVKQRQLAVRREMDRRHIALKIVADDSGIPYPTLASYFPADAYADPAQIPMGAVYQLADRSALPLDLISYLLPTGFQVVRVPDGICHDEIEAACREYLNAKADAHHADSEEGREIGPNERATLDAKVTSLRGAA